MPFHLAPYQEEIRFHEALWRWCDGLLRQNLALSDLIREMTTTLAVSFGLKRVALYLQEPTGLSFKAAAQGSRTWKISYDLNSKFMHAWEKAAKSANGLILGEYLCLALREEEVKSGKFTGEILPLGLLVLGGEITSPAARNRLLEIAHFGAFLLSRQKAMEEIAKGVERTASELKTGLMDPHVRPMTGNLRSVTQSIIGGRAGQMEAVFENLNKMIRSQAPVLIEGETGTGKELVSQAIHDLGPLSAKPFIGINCGALSSALLESELFGHVRGAFTGAIADHAGLLSQADGGTLFLDEIGELPIDLQAKFLRVLQEKEFRPVGSNAIRRVNVRVIAATNRNLEQCVQRGTFREDLFYRLNVLFLRLPPLRERREDIPQLVRFFLEAIAQQAGGPKAKFSAKALAALCAYPWPGNVRELQTTLRLLVDLHGSRRIHWADLPPEIRGGGPMGKQPLRVEKATHEFVRRYLERALRAAGGRVAQAAKIARLKRQSFYRLMQKHLHGSFR